MVPKTWESFHSSLLCYVVSFIFYPHSARINFPTCPKQTFEGARMESELSISIAMMVRAAAYILHFEAKHNKPCIRPCINHNLLLITFSLVLGLLSSRGR